MTKEKGNHAVFSPSASERWINCPGSIKMSEGIEEGKPSVYAHEGTVCHWVAARCLKEHEDASKYLGEVIEEVRMTQELIDAIQVYVDEIKGLTKEYNASGGRIEFEIEINEDCWGTLDAALWTEEILIAGDLKMGKGVIVEAKDNKQLKIYAIGMLRWLQKEKGLNPSRIILYIFQPRTVNPIRKWEISRIDLLIWYTEVLKPTIDTIKSGAEECIPGENQCRWCPASATCTAQASYAIKSTEQAFAPFTEEAKPEVEIATGGKLSLMSIAELLPSFKHIENWMKSLKDYALGKALDGLHVPGYKVVEGRSNRAWKVDEVDIVAFIEAKGYEAYGDPPLLSPAKVEKAMGKKESEAHGLANYIHKPPGAPALVQETDKRPAIDTEVDKALEEAAIMPDPDVLKELTDEVKESMKPGEVVEASSDDATQSIMDMFDDPVIVASDEKEVSAFDRMMNADIEDAPTVPDEVVESSKDVEALFEMKAKEEIATSGSPTSSPAGEIIMSKPVIVLSAKSTGKAKPPLKAAKRLEVLNMGKGGVKLEDVAKALSSGINSIKMHLRYLNERDGYGYEVYSDGTYKVFE